MVNLRNKFITSKYWDAGDANIMYILNQIPIHSKDVCLTGFSKLNKKDLFKERRDIDISWILSADELEEATILDKKDFFILKYKIWNI